jgi:histidinol-phosphate phosphatase family protein
MMLGLWEYYQYMQGADYVYLDAVWAKQHQVIHSRLSLATKEKVQAVSEAKGFPWIHVADPSGLSFYEWWPFQTVLKLPHPYPRLYQGKGISHSTETPDGWRYFNIWGSIGKVSKDTPIQDVPLGGKCIPWESLDDPATFAEMCRYVHHRQPGLFLDRDGILIQDTGYPHRQQDLVLKYDSLLFVRAALARDIHVAVLSNQAGVAKGIFSKQTLTHFTDTLKDALYSHGVVIPHWYYNCGHPEATLPEYRYESIFRKPQPGMLLQAMEHVCYDMSKSLMVGDKLSDQLLYPGLPTLLLEGKYPLNEPLAPQTTIIETMTEAMDYLPTT